MWSTIAPDSKSARSPAAQLAPHAPGQLVRGLPAAFASGHALGALLTNQAARKVGALVTGTHFAASSRSTLLHVDCAQLALPVGR
jgi:hypothetical protein